MDDGKRKARLTYKVNRTGVSDYVDERWKLTTNYPTKFEFRMLWCRERL